MQFDCARCEELLLDFAYGELDEVTAAAFRRHTEGCARCTASLADVRLVREAYAMMPLETPSPDLDARILAAADLRLNELDERKRAKQRDAIRDRSFFGKALDGFRAIATRPQYAMALVLVLVVGIGLVVAPQMRMTEQAAPGVAPTLVGEAGPELEPAVPPPAAAPTETAVAQAQAPLARSSTSPNAATSTSAATAREEASVPANRPAPGPVVSDRAAAADELRNRAAPMAVAPTSPPARAASPDSFGSDGRAFDDAAENGRLRVAQGPRDLEENAEQRSEGGAARGLAGAGDAREIDEQPARQQARVYAPAPPPESADAAYSRRPAQSAPRSSYAPAPVVVAEAQQVQGGLSAERSAGTGGGGGRADSGRADPATFERGMASFRAGRYREAIPDLQAAVARPGLTGDAMATAHLAIARSYRQTGNCGEASRRYEDLMRRFAGYRSNADVNWEAAECYRTLGNSARADELYRVAERSAQYGERARARRVQIEGARRAAPTFDATEAAPAEPARSGASSVAH